MLERVPGATDRGRNMARLLRKELDDVAKDNGSGGGDVVEPVVDASGFAQGEEGIRKALFSASSHFNQAASGPDTTEEKRTHERLRDAMRSPSVPGHPERTSAREAGAACVPDFNRCPVDWNGPGPTCSAPSGYAGPCASRLDFAGMGDEQKVAIARYCGVSFACSNLA